METQNSKWQAVAMKTYKTSESPRVAIRTVHQLLRAAGEGGDLLQMAEGLVYEAESAVEMAGA